MKKFKTSASLHYSRLFSIPIISYLLYQLQTWLTPKLAVNIFFASARQDKYSQNFFNLLSNYDQVTVKSNKFGQSLSQLHAEQIILDYFFDIESASSRDMHELKWSIISSSKINQRLAKDISKIIDIPELVTRSVVIPFYEDLAVYCDFVVKTAAELKNKGYSVHIIAYSNKNTLLSHPLKSLRDFINTEEILIPFVLFPKVLESLYTFKKINEATKRFSTRQLIGRFYKPIIWSFDPQDFQIFNDQNSALKIYDCVDYFSSLDSKTEEVIRSQENALVDSANLVFVNSYALKKIHSDKKQIALVPQGFNLHDFSLTDRVEGKEKQYLSRLKKKIHKANPTTLLGFVGNLNYRIDYELLLNLAKENKNVLIVLTAAYQKTATEDQYNDTNEKIKLLTQQDNIVLVQKSSNKNYIRSLIELFNIGIIPYRSDYLFNKYSYPMKLFEYFYMGKPVLSTPIAELERFPKYVKIGKTATKWSRHIEELLARPWPTSYKLEQRKLAIANSWNKKVGAICKEIEHYEQTKKT
ncbi:MAG: glycosyltransferase family 1 protein [Candidatus Pacebacteria bacterium]|nr:glycosyltransferase family 1 protein [Candidatus Paceibacterota bacterium]